MPALGRPAHRPLPLRTRARWLLTSKRWWALSLAAAVLAAGTMGRAVDHTAAAAARWGARHHVPVATRWLHPGEQVAASDLRHESRPAGSLPDDAAIARDPLGARVLHPIAPGEVVLAARLAPAGLGEVASRLPEGTVGVAVPHDGRGLRLRVGDRVDVIAAFTDEEARDPAFAVVRSAPVVDTGEEGATVAVPSVDAPRVAYALAVGVVTLVLVGGDGVTGDR